MNVAVPANRIATDFNPDGKRHDVGPGKHQFNAIPQ